MLHCYKHGLLCDGLIFLNKFKIITIIMIVTITDLAVRAYNTKTDIRT